MNKKLFLIIPILFLSGCNKPTPTPEEKPNVDPILEFGSYDVLTFQPFYDQSSSVTESEYSKWKFMDEITSYGDMISGAGNYLKNRISSITYKDENKSQREIFTKEKIKTWGKNKIILFEGHGSFVSFDNEDHSVLWNGEFYDQDKETTDDYICHRIVKADDGMHEAITINFIEDYCPDLTGSFIYLGQCFSGRDSTLAQSLLHKGAAAVIGNTHAIQIPYSDCMVYSTCKFLTQVNPKTKLTYTLYEALNKAKSIHGKTDQEVMPMANGAEPLIYGDPNFRLSKFKE